MFPTNSKISQKSTILPLPFTNYRTHKNNQISLDITSEMSKSKTKEFLAQPKNNYPRQKTSLRPLRIYRSFSDHDQPKKIFASFTLEKVKKSSNI